MLLGWRLAGHVDGVARPRPRPGYVLATHRRSSCLWRARCLARGLALWQSTGSRRRPPTVRDIPSTMEDVLFDVRSHLKFT